MIGVLLFFLICLLVIAGATFLLSLPGTVSIEVGNYAFEPSFGVLVLGLVLLVALAIFIWGIGRSILGLPFLVMRGSKARRKERGIKALSDGFIAIYSGDATRARQLARTAGSLLEGNAAAQLLEARAAVMLGNSLEARAHYKALIENPATAIAALTGLYEEARAQGQGPAALAFAEKASSLQPTLEWAGHAVFDDLTRQKDWTAARDYLASRAGQNLFDKAEARRNRGILLTAQALEWESSMPMDALENARDALKLIPYFVPAALVAARVYANRGEVRKASSTLSRIWQHSPHPDIAALYANARQGVGAPERLKRIQTLVKGPISDAVSGQALARAAIDAQDWALAREAIEQFLESAPSRNLCTLMAEISQGEGDDGRTRYWLSRAVNAAADAAWTADGIVSAEWAPTSPETGKLDAFVWQVPVTLIGTGPDVELDSESAHDDEPEPEVLVLDAQSEEETPIIEAVVDETPEEAAPEETTSEADEKEQVKQLDDAQDNARSVF